MFYGLETPSQRWPYICLDEVGVDEFVQCMAERAVDVEAPADSCYLALKVLVMRWSWAPFLARSALQACMGTALGVGSVRARLARGPPTSQLRGRAGGCEALDWARTGDCGVMASSASAKGGEKELPSSMAAKVKSHVESAGLAVHGEEGAMGLESLGAVLRGRPCVIGLCPLKTCRLALVALALVGGPCWTATMLERLVGFWAWAAVFQRTSLAILDQVCHEMRRPSSSAAAFRLSAVARAELAAAAYCAPLMVTCPESPWARRAFVTDSSDVGYGVAVAQATVEEIRAESRYCELRGWTIAAEDFYTSDGCGGYAHDADELAQAAAPVVGGPSVRVFGFLYLFAGVRRSGDLEEYLRRRAGSAGVLIEVWSLDAVIDPKRDLADPDFLNVIVGLVDKGYFRGPWGRADIRLTSLERRRLELGAKSPMAVLAVIRAVCMGGGLSEHPPDPGGPPCPSIWDLAELKDLVEDFGGWVDFLDQCRYGAPSMKPAMVGIFGAFDRSDGGAAARLCLACNHQGRPTIRTAAAQTYQPELCDALSEVIIEAFVHMRAWRLGLDVDGVRGICWWLTLTIFDLVGRASAGREPLQPMGATPMTKRGHLAWDNYATDPNAGLLDGGFTRLLTHLVAYATAAQWASKLTSESEVDRALADCVDIQCYGERKRATLGSVVLFGMLVIWPELRNEFPFALRGLESWQKLAGASEGGPPPEEAIYAIAIYMIEQGRYVEAVCGRRAGRPVLGPGPWRGGGGGETGAGQGAVARRGSVANLVLGPRGFRASKDEELFGIDQVRFRKLWNQDTARGRASPEQVRRRGRWKALSSVQRYSKTFALTQFRARMPEVVWESGMRAGRDLKAEILGALLRRPFPSGSLPEAIENDVKRGLAKDVAAELMEIKSSGARSFKKASHAGDDDRDSSGGLFSGETFGGGSESIQRRGRKWCLRAKQTSRATRRRSGSVSGSNIPYVKQRSSSALASYAPIATKVFGNSDLQLCLRSSLCRSVILSKLLFNAYVRVLKVRELRVLNATCMRVVRRMCHRVNFDGTAGSDIEARRAANMASMDCILLQQRLLHLARLLRFDSRALQALLSQRVAQLDALDAAAGRAARKAGHTRPLTDGPVKQAGQWSMTAAAEPLGARRSGPEDDPVLELRRLHQTSSLNRFYPQRLPAWARRGPDPRRGLGDKAPSCYPRPPLSRAERLMQKWQSMPTHRPQLPSIDLPDTDDSPPAPEPDGEVARTVQRARRRRGETRSRFCEQRSTKDGHQFPHIPCSCCSRTTPRRLGRRA
ncbi:unnamed protein product [Prorocentrum cordatum]|uniref:Uncharacterized protein n=1 Tax=Prorocentrum cordatum TaxID=2364126 RepID=A0ABN9X756_9DINO|nr:unnamed protein product [Polarella glacialis]